MSRLTFRVIGAASVLLCCLASDGLSRDWQIVPYGGVFVPVTAGVDTPGPTYDVGLAGQVGAWRCGFGYVGGGGTAENGWDPEGGPSAPGDYDFYMTGLTVTYLLSSADRAGLICGVGGGIWFEHLEFEADPGPEPEGPVTTGHESDQFILCAQGLVGYSWTHVEVTANGRVFLGSDNVTSALSLGVGFPF